MRRKNIAAIILLFFISSVIFTLLVMPEEKEVKSRPYRLGEFCIAQVYPVDTDAVTETPEKKEPEIKETVAEKTEVKKEKTVDNSKPQVIIYHTHSSESYQPYTESNFHREAEEGTVREVGNVMAEELNRLGVSVVHDKTVHDRPSYNESYTRSKETITSLMKKYPMAKVVIDLHRDAAAYTGNVGETMDIEGETVAKYKLVVGQANDNYSKLMGFADKVNNAADALYPGFSGRIIEKEYNYNEYVADNYLLLEVGNNQNDIAEVRNTGKYFARVLAKVLEEN